MGLQRKIKKIGVRRKLFLLFVSFLPFLPSCTGDLGGGLLSGGAVSALSNLVNSNERFILGHLGRKTKVNLRGISFSASGDANEDAAVSVHLVIVHDPFLIADFIKMPADTYFRSHRQLERDHKSTLQIYKWTIAPGAYVGEKVVRYPGSPVAAFLFSRYSSPGDHRLRIGPERDILVKLEKTDWHFIPATSND